MPDKNHGARVELAGKPGLGLIWRAPPPNVYFLKSTVGYWNHDPTVKTSPAFSMVRYVYPPRPKVKVSTPPFIKALCKNKPKKKKSKKGGGKKKKNDPYVKAGSRKMLLEMEENSSETEVSDLPEASEKTFKRYKKNDLHYRLVRRTSSTSELFLRPLDSPAVICKICKKEKKIDNKNKFDNSSSKTRSKKLFKAKKVEENFESVVATPTTKTNYTNDDGSDEIETVCFEDHNELNQLAKKMGHGAIIIPMDPRRPKSQSSSKKKICACPSELYNLPDAPSLTDCNSSIASLRIKREVSFRTVFSN